MSIECVPTVVCLGVFNPAVGVAICVANKSTVFWVFWVSLVLAPHQNVVQEDCVVYQSRLVL